MPLCQRAKGLAFLTKTCYIHPRQLNITSSISDLMIRSRQSRLTGQVFAITPPGVLFFVERMRYEYRGVFY